MKNNIQFYEKQNRKPWWLVLLMILLNLPFIYGIVWQLVLGNQFGNNPMSNTGLIIASAVIFITTGLLLLSKMETEINNSGIYYRYFPFNVKFKYIPWTAVSKAYIRQYRSLSEFGGSGIRLSPNGKAYIVSGNYGLQLELTNGKKIMLATRHPNDIDEVLKKLEAQKGRKDAASL